MVMMNKNKKSKRKEVDQLLAQPGSLASLTLKRVERNDELESAHIEASSKAFDIDNLQKSLKRRPWILHDQITNLEELDRKHLDKNLSLQNSLPKGVIRGCSSCNDCRKVTAHWQPEERCSLQIDYAPVFHPTEEEFENTLQYIAKIRPEGEKYGICIIVPPDSWQPHCLIEGKKIWERSRFCTHIQQIDELQNLYSKRKLARITEKTKENRKTSMTELNHESDGFEFESGPEFTPQTFRTYADHFKRHYFQTDFGTPSWENLEGEYWRIVQNPTEEIQVLSGRNLEAKVLRNGFPLLSDSLEVDQIKYIKSGWNLNNTPKLPGSLLAFEGCNGSAALTTTLDVGMCFSSICWKVEEHSLYALSYLHLGASRILYGIPSTYYGKCESLLKKTFPELLGHPELFHKLVTQLSPSALKSEGIPVYRCVQYPKQFVLVFPGAYYSGFDCGFNISERVNLAPYDWLPYGQQTVEIYRELRRKTSISYDELLMEGAKAAVKSSWLSKLMNSKQKVAGGSDGWLTGALKLRVKWEHMRREYLRNASESRIIQDFGSTKRECIICFYDLYLSASSCPCSPDKYACLEHSKQLCLCSWSSRIFHFRYTIDELNRLIDALEGKLVALDD